MNKKCYFASSNMNKAKELENIFNQKFTLVDNFSVDENKDTYLGNALLKAEHLFKSVNCTVLADDSGLEVEALPNDLGVKTARFGGENLTAIERNNLLLQKMDGKVNRNARFVCALVLYLGKDYYVSTQAILEGQIALKSSGKNGHGYDPIFYLSDYGCTMADISDIVKNQISHRSLAASLLKPAFKTLLS